jgi:hypothetical protein
MAAASIRSFHRQTNHFWGSVANRRIPPSHSKGSLRRTSSERPQSSTTGLRRHPTKNDRGNAKNSSSTSNSSNNNNNNNNTRVTRGVDDDVEYILRHYRIRRRGQKGHGSREYLLVPPDVDVDDPALLVFPPKQETTTATTTTGMIGGSSPSSTAASPSPQLPVVVAALLAHRNILFGARAFLGYDLQQVCPPLVRWAIQEAGENGEQPQAVASLKGLSGWVESCLHLRGGEAKAVEGDETSSDTCEDHHDHPANTTSQVLLRLERTDPVAFEAVRAIATGIPGPGRSVVGAGTFRNGEEAWKALAREYVELGLAPEVSLYQSEGGRLVAIEHLADRSPNYLESAGGAMARLFFL